MLFLTVCLHENYSSILVDLLIGVGLASIVKIISERRLEFKVRDLPFMLS